MKKLGGNGLKLLKLCHLICAIAWMGTAMGFLLELCFIHPQSSQEAYIYAQVMKMLDDWVLVAGAYGILLTGIVYGIWTNFGFFKYRWLVAKWILTIAMVLLGTFGMGPLAEENALNAGDPIFYHQCLENLFTLKWFAVIQNILLLLVIFLSIFKPGGKRGAKENYNPVAAN